MSGINSSSSSSFAIRAVAMMMGQLSAPMAAADEALASLRGHHSSPECGSESQPNLSEDGKILSLLEPLPQSRKGISIYASCISRIWNRPLPQVLTRLRKLKHFLMKAEIDDHGISGGSGCCRCALVKMRAIAFRIN
jgi:hypothetical protein